MASAIEIVVTARDDASRVLDNVKNQLVVFDQFGRVASNLEEPIERTRRAVTQLDTSFLRAGRNVRLLSLPLVSELSPALGQTANQLAGVATSAALLGRGMTSLGLAAAGVAGLLIGQLVSSLRASAEAKEAFNKAVRTGDIAKMTDEVSKLGRELTALQNIRLLEQGGPMAVQAARDVAARSAELGADVINKDAQRRAAAMQEAELEDLLAVQAFEERQAQLRIDNRRAQRGLFDFQLDPVEVQFRQQLRQADDLALAGDRDAAGRLRGAASTQRSLALGQRFAAGAPVNPFETTEGQAADRKAREALVVAEDAADRARVEAFLKGAPVSPFETAEGGDAERRAREGQVLADETERLRLIREESQLKVGLLDVDSKRLDLLGQLTPELSAQLTLMQAAVIAADETLTPQQKQLALAQANLAVMKEMMALDPLAGLAAGFSRMATESRKLGTELEHFAEETSDNMARSFSDNFFNLFTGRKGQDLGRQFGDMMLRSFTDVLGRQLSGGISGLFAQALGGVRAMVPGGAGGFGGFDLLSLFGGGGGGGGPILSPTGAPAGSLVMTPGGPGFVMPSGGVQLVSGGAGGGMGDLSSLIPSPSTLQTGFNLVTGRGPSLFDFGTAFSAGGANAIAALNAGQAVVSGGQFISNAGELALSGISSPGVAGASSAGLTGAAAASGILAGVALGFTIFSGLQGAPTATNIALGTVSGALSGAVLGATVGSIFPGVGTVIGAVVGAIAGGLLGGGSAALGKGGQGKKASAADRSAAIGEMSASNLSAAIDTAASIEDLVTIFNRQWAPHGEVQILTTYQGVVYWAGDFDDAPGAVATVELMIIPEFLDQLEIQVGQTGAPQRRQDLIDKFRAKRDEILETLSNIPFGILESDRAAGITRRTYLPFQQLYSLQKGTQQLFGSSEFYRRDLGGEDETVAFLLQRLMEYSVRKDIDISRQDFIFR